VKLLLDTSAYSALMRGQPDVVDRVRNTEAIVLSAVVAAELFLGFRLGTRFKKNMDEFTAFLDNRHVSFVAVSLTTADRCSRIAADLRRKGRPIPTNDMWIAAHTIETGAELLSSDDHFEAIDGLVWTRIAPHP